MTAYKYDRRCRLLINSDTKTFDLSEFRIVFSVTHGSTATPKTLHARVYNLSHGGSGSSNTVAEIQAATNKTITLSAYYASQNPSILFSGQVRQVYAGRESPVDTYLDIGASAFEALNATAGMNKVLAAGWTHRDVFQDVLTGLPVDSTDTHPGSFPTISGSGARPKVCYGNVRDGLRAMGRNTASVVFQHDTGRVDFVPVADLSKPTASDKKLYLSPANGLIGIPVQIPEGIQAKALLDSSLAPRAVVSIYSKNDSDSHTAVTQTQLDLDYAGINGGNADTDANGNGFVRGLAHNGDYRILYVEHSGDTRGETWQTVLVGQAMDPSDQSVMTQNAASATDD